MKVLHLPTNVAGMSWGLAQGEKRLGLESTVLSYESGRFGYPSDICLHWERKSSLGRLANAFGTFLKIKDRYDVFHFNYGRTLIDDYKLRLNNLDLPYYPAAAKKIFTFNGCDARIKSRSMELYEVTPCSEADCNGGICSNGTLDRIKRRSIAKITEYADHIFAVNPDLLHNLPPDLSTFLPYAIASWYQIERQPYSPGEKIKIAHAPTNRAVKGSSYILAALEKLSRRYPIEVCLIENVPHAEALRLYASADLVIDQVLAGWYGGVAVEVMKMGKPLAVYIREEDLVFIPPAMAEDLRNSVINLTPFTVEEVLESYLENRQLLNSKAEAAYHYVMRWHDPVYVASLTKQAYES